MKGAKTPKKSVPKLPPFTSLADSVHASEGNLHPDQETAHVFEVCFTKSRGNEANVKTLEGHPRAFIVHCAKVRSLSKVSSGDPPGQEEFSLRLQNIPCGFSSSGEHYSTHIARHIECSVTFQYEDILYSSTPPNHLPSKYGSYHQLYKLDGQLIALAVLDILPNCVSSVYFMYDKDWERFSMGKVGNNGHSQHTLITILRS